jgi:hypothetical protein
VFYNSTTDDNVVVTCSPATHICSTAAPTHLQPSRIRNTVFLRQKFLVSNTASNISSKNFDIKNNTTKNTSLKEINEWSQYPLVFSAIVDERYLHPAEVFVESLLTLGYGLSDLLLICASLACSHHLTEKQIPHVLFRNTRCGTEPNHVDIRCAISDAKLAATASLLKAGISVFLFDLDVYFKADPLSFALASETLLYAQENDLNDANNRLNFGMFLVRPNNITANMFADMTNKFRLTNAWDQKLFNDFVRDIKLPSVILHRIPNFGFGFDYYQFDPANMTVVHMVCVEGAENKLLLARELFGPFATPQYYRKHRTLTWAYDGRGFGEVQLIVGMLTTIAQATKRALRITNWSRYREVVSLFDADTLLRDDHVYMVEEKYWMYAMQAFPDLASNFTMQLMNISNHDDVQRMVNSNNDSRLAAAHDLNIKFLEVYTIDPFPWPNQGKYLCYYATHKKHWCLRTCQGNHF